MVTLDIISDPVCPWCHIGKARLDRALAASGRNPFAIRWRPFRLNPDMPPGGMDRDAYLAAKFGAARVGPMLARIEAIAAAEGIPIDFARMRRMPDTLDAHRLLRWAREGGRQHAVAGGLFRRFFAEGGDISAPELLVETAAEAGMDGGRVRDLLASEADREAVRAEDAAARRMGVGGVPTFIVAGRYVLQGAEETETWCRVIDEIAALPATGAAG